MISDSAETIHITKDICDKLKIYYKKMEFGKACNEIQQLILHNGDLTINFDAFENVQGYATECMETRKVKLLSEAMSKKGIKIGSRIQAINAFLK